MFDINIGAAFIIMVANIYLVIYCSKSYFISITATFITYLILKYIGIIEIFKSSLDEKYFIDLSEYAIRMNMMGYQILYTLIIFGLFFRKEGFYNLAKKMKPN